MRPRRALRLGRWIRDLLPGRRAAGPGQCFYRTHIQYALPEHVDDGRAHLGVGSAAGYVPEAPGAKRPFPSSANH